jgi:hypothetical protein
MASEVSRTFVATLSVHVDNQQLSVQEEEVYLSQKDGFAFGDIVEIVPLQTSIDVDSKRKNQTYQADKCTCMLP